MGFDIPTFSGTWASRAHTVKDSQLRRRDRTNAPPLAPLEQQQHQKPQTPQPKKRDWWRLDPNASNKYKAIEPPATPDPDIVPTLDRIVFGWEAPLSPLEQVLQEDVRKLYPKLHEWIVRRAIERAGLLPPDASGNRQPVGEPGPQLRDIDLDQEKESQ